MSRERANGEHLTQKEQDELAARYARVTVQPMGWVCPKCGSVMAPHLTTCVRCSNAMGPATSSVPDVQCMSREAHILAGGHQSTGPR